MVTRLDRDVGQIFGRLKARGIDRDTVVFFCSDNGAARRWDGLFDSSGPLRGRKRDLYEGGIRTPMIVRWPGRVPAGRVEEETPWYFPDVLPTLAAMAGAPEAVPEDIDGVSVLPLLLGNEQPDLRGRTLYWEFFEGGFQQAARRDHWKAVRPKMGGDLELYDLDRDPGEENDVAADHTAVVAEMEGYLESARTPSPHWPLDAAR